MSIPSLHHTYAPIMHFSRGENFHPMSVADFLTYSALHAKGAEKPLVPRGALSPTGLAPRRRHTETFLRSVDAGPFEGAEVVRQWSAATLRLLYDWMQKPTLAWSESLARQAYEWFSDKTRDATKLFWWNDLLFRGLNKNRLSREDLPRFHLPDDVRQSALAAYQESQSPHANFTYYYRMVAHGGYLNLQYWFFYAYNDWANGFGGFNDHEGDWEGLQLFFKFDGDRVIEPPAFITYLGHHSRITKPWQHREVEKQGTHPVVYVAAGSHASYPNARQYPLMAFYNLVDYATGDDFTLDYDAWRSRIHLDEAPWLLDYRGSWGTRYWLNVRSLLDMLALVGFRPPQLPKELSLPGVSAPRGPRFDDEGRERATWNRALDFAGIGA
ncbi:MAG: hypothetical protein HUU23_02750 [Caldilineales bacterium]|nr:hypothetical protein [Caldilineales bacterium]